MDETMTTTYDAIVIGTGQSGPALADRLNREGLKTAVVERHLMGGTCVNVGCIPMLGVTPRARFVTLWLNDGGRPDHFPPTTVAIRLNDRPLGTVTVTSRFEPYRFEIPADLAELLAVAEDAGVLEIASPLWNPAETLGGTDTREVGVMVDRITIEE